jgi:hypothetical protein
MTKTLFATLTCLVLHASIASAQHIPAGDQGVPGCGDPKIKFDVQTSKMQPPAQADAGKALVYFIEDDTNFESLPRPTTRLGIDGEWAGATHGNSYLVVSVDPGVHHLCASWQSLTILWQSNQTAATHFTAEAGGVYYFQVKNNYLRTDGKSPGSGIVSMTLNLLDSDEGQLQANRFKLSISHPKN